MEDNKDLKNGYDLLLLCYLTIETMEEYKLKGLVKKYANLFKNSIEKVVTKGIDAESEVDETLLHNSLKYKKRMVSDIANLNEVDQILLSEFVHKFVQNIDLARKKGLIFFDKLL